MKAKRFNITMNEELLTQLDRAAELEFASRSDFIRVAVVARLTRLKAALQVNPEAVSDKELEAAFQVINTARMIRIGTDPESYGQWQKKTRPTLYRDNENC